MADPDIHLINEHQSRQDVLKRLYEHGLNPSHPFEHDSFTDYEEAFDAWKERQEEMLEHALIESMVHDEVGHELAEGRTAELRANLIELRASTS